MKKENCNNQMCLDDLRKNIDEIDEKMRRLFIERLNVVKNIAIEKIKCNSTHKKRESHHSCNPLFGI